MTARPDDQMPEDEALAAEYALGLLTGAEHAAFAARLADDAALAALVRGWEARLAALAEAEVAPVTPPDRARAQLMARLFDAAPPARQAVAQPLWDRVAFWRGVSLVSSAVAAVAVGVAVLPDSQPPGLLAPVPGLVPDLDSGAIPAGTILLTHLVPLDGSGLGLAATRDPEGRVELRRVAGGPTPGRAQQVWLVIDDATPPVSLGLLGDDPQTVLTPPPEIGALFGAGASLAISDEPPGGSPTGAPTGAILALGRLVAL